MKKFLLTTFTCLTFSFVFSQSFTIKEFETFLKMEQDDFETAVMKKKFVLDETEEDGFDCNCYTYQYAYDRNSYDAKAAKFILLYVYKDGKQGVSYQTADQTEYVKLKSALKISGYKLDLTQRSEDGETIFYFYKKGKINLSLNTTVKKYDGVITNSYFLHFDNK